MRPIDADELEKFLYWDNDIEAWYLDGKDLDDFSTIKPEDLRPKGKWEQKRDYWNMFLNVCSNCGRSEFLAPPYCAGCGAKMETDE